jgi:hypothetical protein
MYFKLQPIQRDKYTDMGMINVSADLYLEEGDIGYDKYIAEHRVQVPIIPEGGYTQQKELDAATLVWEKKQEELYKFNPKGDFILESYEEYVNYTKERDAYDNWIKSLPKMQQLNPFCNHSIQFEHDVTEEEILWCFEFALGITHRNYLIDDLHCKKGGQIVNQDIKYSARRAFYQGINLIPENNRSDYMKQEMAKIEKVKTRMINLQKTEFHNIETIGKYKVKK